MRPLRFLLTLLSFIAAFFLLLCIGPWRHVAEQDVEVRGSIGAYFNWRAPSSLFPPSAVISITDDNSTNFLARPAAFGPLLPPKSLSGQLWIGSGFGEERLGRGGSGAGADGELGCSDVPGWEDGTWSSGGKKTTNEVKAATADGSTMPLGSNNNNNNDNSNAKHRRKRASAQDLDEEENDGVEHPTSDDGTDDHLHHPLPASDGLKTNGDSAGNTKRPTHADIQSLQESAEITGKVVLLSRGGCGFLEKVKWVQRRGGIALIVGDDIRGGPLVTMYARGDTSNVTIPSLFTSHTTAQLLSHLMPSGSLIEDATRLGFAIGDKVQSETDATSKQKNVVDKPNFTTTTATTKATSTAHPGSKYGSNKHSKNTYDESEHHGRPHRGWFAALFGDVSDSREDSRRPPSSGNMGWVLQEEFEDEDFSHVKMGRQSSSSASTPHAPTTAPNRGPSDGFQIGVQDWRDPDLVAEQKEQQLKGTLSSSSSAAVAHSSKPAATSLRGGSITPGSGEYGNVNREPMDIAGSKKPHSKDDMTSHETEDHDDDLSRGWLGRLFSSADPGKHAKPEPVPKAAAKAPELDESHHANTNSYHRHDHSAADGPQMHEGLWVTLSPASMASSPFFDTLLVLVVSPLVTLTVVYALLLLRSRMRRRRWRAPKSVVERLPVRTYQTMPSGATSSSTSSIASLASATTPLLPSASRPMNTRARPRARTASEVPHGSSARSDDMASPSLEQVEEARAAGLAEWRRRYGGKQRECVVCLEEYVDGVSRVMSLPCGHEFHAECITPWLTTRRRTCPICKGDVVRSLARNAGSASSSSSSSVPLPQPYSDADSEGEEDLQEQVVTTVNDDPAAQQPISREDEAFEDLERGLDRTR